MTKTDDYIQKLLEEPEWELNVIKAYKAGKIDMDKEKFIEVLEQERHRIYLGGYHVFTTVEEADKFVNYLDTCLTMLKD